MKLETKKAATLAAFCLMTKFGISTSTVIPDKVSDSEPQIRNPARLCERKRAHRQVNAIELAADTH
ncbi:hypothetical protein [Pannonibacter carbonis]|uniref:hypothetical protein n=1 Tax=Pannonibacter carbonis TaxID=2067569 RepID=UPI000D0E5EF4|nr:hypothetical protein [Pannonibacter carbonis]